MYFFLRTSAWDGLSDSSFRYFLKVYLLCEAWSFAVRKKPQEKRGVTLS